MSILVLSLFKCDKVGQAGADGVVVGLFRLLLCLEGTVLGRALRLLQQLQKLLPGHAPAESSPASPKPASFEVKSLSVSGRAQNESQELCFSCLPQEYSELAGGAHTVNKTLLK